MQYEYVDEELHSAEVALQHLRSLNQALTDRLQQPAVEQQEYTQLPDNRETTTVGWQLQQQQQQQEQQSESLKQQHCSSFSLAGGTQCYSSAAAGSSASSHVGVDSAGTTPADEACCQRDSSEPTLCPGLHFITSHETPQLPPTHQQQGQERNQAPVDCCSEDGSCSVSSTALLQCPQHSSGHCEQEGDSPGKTLQPAPTPGHTPAPAPSKQPAWKVHVQEEQQLLHMQQRKAVAAATARQQREVHAQEVFRWEQEQQHLPFQVLHSKLPSKATHKLQRTLSMMLQQAAAVGQHHQPGSLPAKRVATMDCSSESLTNRSPPTLPAESMAGRCDCSTSTATAAAGDASGACSTSSLSELLMQDNQAASTHPHSCPAPAQQPSRQRSRTTSSSRPALLSKEGKQQAWAAADADTDAQVCSYLREQWQQQHLQSAALVLQCAWRSRAARHAFHRYLCKRRASVVACTQPALLQWHRWSSAASHHRRQRLRAALREWRALVQLQLELCSKVVRGLRRGVLSGDLPGLMMWRLCTTGQQRLSCTRPCFGGMLGSILLTRVPQAQLKGCLKAWRQACDVAVAMRARVTQQLVAAAAGWRRQQLREGLRFWHRYTMACTCERLHLQLPAFPQRCRAFDDWLWEHEHRQQLRRRAAGLAGQLGLLRCFVRWRRHMHKMAAMKAAWSGRLLHTREELLWAGLIAFKVNRQQQQLHRRLMAAAVSGWRELVAQNKAVAAVRHRIKQVAEARRKAAGLLAFQRHCRLSQLLSAAAVVKQWHALPLVLAHVHAWLHDTLHATFYLCWWRWKRRAVARLRWRVALGVHMYRAHWLQLELVFRGWRKVVVMAKRGAPSLDQAAADCPVAAAAQPYILPASCEQNGLAAGACSPQQQQQQQQRQQQANSLPAELSQHGNVAATCPSEAPGPAVACEDSASITQPGCGASCSPPVQPRVVVSLADFPSSQPWRPLLGRRAVMAAQGMRRATGLRLGRAVRDMRELEGSFMAKDTDSGVLRLLSSRVFAAQQVSPGLKAMATAGCPMNVLWRAAFPADAFWWQRVVGLLLQQHAQGHDCWQPLLHPAAASCSVDLHSTSSSSTGASGTHGTDPSDCDLKDLLDAANSSCVHNCRCARCHVPEAVAAAAPTEATAKPAADAAAAMARARLRLRAGLALDPLRLPDSCPAAATPDASCTPAADSAAATPGPGLQPADSGGCSSCAAQHPQALSVASGCGGVSRSSSGGSSTSSSSCRGGGEGEVLQWPPSWRCADIALLCRLVQAEVLLETAVHGLLGIGADSSAELYGKLQQMAKSTQPALQGDLLLWLLSGVLAHDMASAHEALTRARLRDELLLSTMELRERALALHLHIPHKFTLTSTRPCGDVRAAWASVITRVEQERDWHASSADESDDDPREQQWLDLLQQQHGPHLQLPGMAALGGGPLQDSPACEPPGQPLTPTRQPGSLAASAAVGAAAAPVMTPTWAAAVLQVKEAAGLASVQLAPGTMLAQGAQVADEGVWPQHGRRTPTPVPAASPLQQEAQQQLDAAERLHRQQLQQQQQRAQQQKLRHDKQAMAAAQGLFGRSRGAPGALSPTQQQRTHGVDEATGLPGASVDTGLSADDMFFPGPDFSLAPYAMQLGALPIEDVPEQQIATTAGPSRGTSAGGTMQQHLATLQLPVLQQPQAARQLPHEGAEQGRSGTGGSAASSSLQQPGGNAAALPAVAPGANCDQELRAELQAVLTVLLGPGPGALSGAAGAVGAAASGAVPDSDDVRQSAHAVAYGLADACAEWVLRQAGQDGHHLQDRGGAPAAAAVSGIHGGPPRTKPFSAPCTLPLHAGSSSSSLGGSSSSSMFEGRGRAPPLAVLRRRPASASAATAPVGPDAGGAAQHDSPTGTNSRPLSAATLAADSTGCAGGAGVDGSGPHSWAARALAQGLLSPSQADLCGLQDRAPQQQQAAGEHECNSSTQDDAAAGGCDGGPWPSSSCSSLLSIPNVQGPWSQQQQQQRQQPFHAGGTCPKPLRTMVLAAPPASTAQQQQGQQHMLQGRHQLPPASAHVEPYLLSTLAAGQSTDAGPVGLSVHPMDPSVQHLLPRVVAALQALQDQPQAAHTHHTLLQGVHQALGLLEPALLQAQVQQLLLQQQQQQQQHAASAAESYQGVPVLPWGGELQPPAPEAGAGQAASPAGVAVAAGVLAQLLTASLNTRVAFWQQAAAHTLHSQGQLTWEQGGLSAWQAHQLHHLAWSSLLVTSTRHHPTAQCPQQQQQQQQQLAGQGDDGSALAALRRQLHTYLVAHMQWRQQKQVALPLAPAEKWVMLEHEEQVLDFITGLTIAVHQQLLRKHRQLPASSPLGSSRPAAFGSSSSRLAAAQAVGAQLSPMPTLPAGLTAVGTRVTQPDARRLVPTISRRRPPRLVPVYVVLRPAKPAPHNPCPQRLAPECLEPLQGWCTDIDHGLAAGGVNSHADAVMVSAGLHAPLSQVPVQGVVGPLEPEQQPRRRTTGSTWSSESSWAG